MPLRYFPAWLGKSGSDMKVALRLITGIKLLEMQFEKKGYRLLPLGILYLLEHPGHCLTTDPGATFPIDLGFGEMKCSA